MPTRFKVAVSALGPAHKMKAGDPRMNRLSSEKHQRLWIYIPLLQTPNGFSTPVSSTSSVATLKEDQLNSFDLES